MAKIQINHIKPSLKYGGIIFFLYNGLKSRPHVLKDIIYFMQFA